MFNLAEVSKSLEQPSGRFVKPSEKQPNIVPWTITSALHRWNQKTQDINEKPILKELNDPLTIQLAQVRLYIESGCSWGLFKYRIKIPFCLEWRSPLTNKSFKHIHTHRLLLSFFNPARHNMLWPGRCSYCKHYLAKRKISLIGARSLSLKFLL